MAASAACALAGSGILHGSDILYWKNGVTGSWFTPANWNPNGDKIPTAVDDAVINNLGRSQIAAPGAVASGVYVGHILGGQLTISGGGTLVSSSATIGQDVGGVANVTGAGSSWNTGGSYLSVGTYGGDGTLNITNGGLVTSASAELGYDGTTGNYSSGRVLVDGAGSRWNASGHLTIGSGNYGWGSLTVTNGGTVAHASAALFSPLAGGSSTVVVDGVGSTWNLNQTLSLYGYKLGASVAITGGASVNVGSGAGEVSLGPNSTLNIGNGGTAGTLNASAVGSNLFGENYAKLNFDHTGGTVFAPSIVGKIGVTKSGSGTTILTGPANSYNGTTTINAGALLVGDSGVASFGPGDIVNSGTFAINSSSAIMVSGAISGPGTLLKTGTGVLTLTNANTYTGGTAIWNGAIEFSSASNFGNSGNITLDGGGLRWASGNTVDISPRLAAIASKGASFDTNGNDVSLATALAGTGGLAKNGAGTLTVTGASTYTGATTINGGTLKIGSGSAFASSSIINNAALVFAPTGSLTLSSALSGSGIVTATSGTTTLTGTSSYTGETHLTGGAVNVSGTVNAGSYYIGYQGNGTLTVNGGGTLATGTAYLGRFTGNAGYAHVSGTWTAPTVIVGYQGGGELNLSPGGTLNANVVLGSSNGSVGTFNIGNGTLNASTISGGTGGGTVNFNHTGYVSTGAAITGKLAIVKSGSGTTTLSGENSHTGSTTVNAGTLALGSNSALSSSSALIINGGTLALGAYSGTAASLSGNGGNLTLGGDLIVDQSADTTAATGISGNTGNFTKLGTGALTLSGASAIIGQTAVNGGALNVSGSLSTGGVHIGENGFAGAVTVSGTLAATHFLTVGDHTGGPGAGGTGLLTIADGGVVSLGHNAQLTVGWFSAIGTLDLQSGGRLEIGGTDGLQKHGLGTATVTLSGGTIKAVHADLTTSLPMTLSGAGPTIDTNGLAATFSGALSGTGALTKVGAGTLTLSTANSYTGDTTVNGGTLALSTASLADAADVSVASGAALHLGFSGTDTIGALYLNGISQSAGVWGGMSSSAPNKSPYLTGDGLLNVTGGAPTFVDWISTFDLTGNDALAAADPDHDGLGNLLEWVLGGNPVMSDAGLFPDPVLTSTDLIFTFHRTDDSEAEVALVFQYGSNLLGWTDVAIGAAGAGQVTVDEGTPESEPDLITVTLPRNSNPKLFGRLKAVK